jgi:hypothetical protein
MSQNNSQPRDHAQKREDAMVGRVETREIEDEAWAEVSYAKSENIPRLGRTQVIAEIDAVKEEKSMLGQGCLGWFLVFYRWLSD